MVEANLHRLESKRQTAYVRHTQTFDMTFPMANLFWGLRNTTSDDKTHAFLKTLAVDRVGVAINVMILISDESYGGRRTIEKGKELIQRMEKIQQSVLNGDDAAFEDLNQMFQDNMMASRSVLTCLDKSIEAKVKELDVLRSRQDTNRDVQAVVTLLGLVVLLLKDVPIWRLRRNKAKGDDGR